MQVILQADQRPKQNHKDEILPAHPQELYLLGRELGLMLNQENIRSTIIRCRRNWSIFFVMEVYLATMMGDWILENKRSSSGSFCVLSSLVWRSLESVLGSRRRSEKEISVPHWNFRNNSSAPSSSRSCRTQSCAINLHSIINSGLIPGGQNLSNRQTVFFLPVDPMSKEHKDPDTIDLGAPRVARYMHKAWKKH